MNFTPLELDELNDLLDDLVAGVLTTAQTNRLNSLLHSSPDAQQVYLDYLAIHTALSIDAQKRPTKDDVQTALRSPLSSGGLVDIDVPLLQSPSTRTQFVGAILGYLDESLNWISRVQVTPRILAIATAAALSSYFVGLLVMIAFEQRPATAPPPGSTRESGQTAAGVAYLAEVGGCIWNDGRPQPIVNAGQSLVLLAGIAEFRYSTGVNVAVQGPCSLGFESSRRLAIRHGKLLARVPRGAEGFTVASPWADVVDLGTEFAVEVTQTGETSVQVLKGKVNVMLPGGDGAAAAGPRDAVKRDPAKRDTVKLNAGQAARVDVKGGIERIAPDPARITFNSDFNATPPAERQGSPAADNAAGLPRLAPSGRLLPSRVAKIWEEDSVDHASEHAYPVSARDLINQGQPSLLGVESSLAELSIGSSIEKLNDGAAGAQSSPVDWSALKDGAWLQDGEWSVTFKLRGAYDIDEIDTYAGWDLGRISQAYRIFTSTDPAQKIFSEFPLADVTFLAETGSSRVQLTAENGGPIALGVTAIRFEIGVPKGPIGMTTVYREIDVVGSPAAGAGPKRRSGDVDVKQSSGGPVKQRQSQNAKQ